MTYVPPVDNSRRASTILSLFKVNLVLTIIAIPLNMFYIMLLNHQLDMNPDMGDFLLGIVGVIRFILLIILCVTFIMWFRRAYHNLHRIGVQGLSHSEGWAAGAWFVPFINLVRPFTIMKEIWYKTQEFTRKEGEQIKDGSILGWWWALYLIGNFISQIGVRIELRSDGDPDMLQLSALLGILADLIDVIDMIILLRVIKNISSFEDRLFHFNWKEFFGEKQPDSPPAG